MFLSQQVTPRSADRNQLPDISSSEASLCQWDALSKSLEDMVSPPQMELSGSLTGWSDLRANPQWKRHRKSRLSHPTHAQHLKCHKCEHSPNSILQTLWWGDTWGAPPGPWACGALRLERQAELPSPPSGLTSARGGPVVRPRGGPQLWWMQGEAAGEQRDSSVTPRPPG